MAYRSLREFLGVLDAAGALKRIGEPISTAGMTTHQRAELTAAVRQKIVDMLK